jgi:hypothetical protein
MSLILPRRHLPYSDETKIIRGFKRIVEGFVELHLTRILLEKTGIYTWGRIIELLYVYMYKIRRRIIKTFGECSRVYMG